MRPKLTLVQTRTALSAVSAEDTEEAKFLEDLRGLIWTHPGYAEGNWKDLAAKARLNERTISRFASGVTCRPNLFTIRRIFIALDYEIIFVPKGGPRINVRKKK